MSRSRCRYAKNVTYSVTCVTSQNVTLSGRYEGDEKPPPQPPPSELFWGRRRSLQAFGRGCISAFAGARNTGQSAASGEVSARLQHAQLVASKYKQAKEKLKIDRPVRWWGSAANRQPDHRRAPSIRPRHEISGMRTERWTTVTPKRQARDRTGPRP